MQTRGRPARRRAQVLDYVTSCTRRDGVAPSYGMIRSDLGFSSDGEIRRIVIDLVEMGKLKRAGFGKVRRIRLMNFD